MDLIDLLIYAAIFLWRFYADSRFRKLIKELQAIIEEQQAKELAFRAQVNQRLGDLETSVIDSPFVPYKRTA